MYGSIVRCVILAAKLHCLCDIWNSQEKGTARGGEAHKYRRQGQHGKGEGGTMQVYPLSLFPELLQQATNS